MNSTCAHLLDEIPAIPNPGSVIEFGRGLQEAEAFFQFERVRIEPSGSAISTFDAI